MRKVGLILMTAAAALLLSAGASAWACTNLASLNPSAGVGNPGTQIDVSGTAFATKGGSDVAIRWDSITGVPLATTKPDATGTIRTSVIIPADAKPGNHILIATQEYTDSKGAVAASYGTPARASFTVGGLAPVAPAAPAAPASSAAAAPAGNSAGLIALTVALGVGGFALFGASLAVSARQARKRPVPVSVEKR